MTLIVGVLCKDGVVIGSDSAITFGAGNYSTVEQKATKVRIIDNQLLLSGTGEVGLSQRFRELVKKYWKDASTSAKNNIEIGKDLCELAIRDFESTGAKLGNFGAALAFCKDEQFYLCEFPANTFQPEYKFDSLWYVSMGSGQIIADPFLGFVRELFWEDKQPKLNEGIFGTLWALEHAINVNAGGVNGPVQIGILSKEKDSYIARVLDDAEIQEHKEHLESIKNRIKDYKREEFNKKSVEPIPKYTKPIESVVR